MGNFLLSQFFEINLIDWKKDGWISCTNSASPVIVYKIPRDKLYLHDNDGREDESTTYISNSGIYILIGEDGQTYVGQVSTRETQESFRDRLSSHDKNKDFWNEAIAITKTTNPGKSYDKSELDYLENKFMNAVIESSRYGTKNTNIQTRNIQNINIRIASRQSCDIDFEMAKLYLFILGYDLFEESLNEPSIVDTESEKKIVSKNQNKPIQNVTKQNEKTEQKKKTHITPISYTIGETEYKLSESERTWKRILDNVIKILASIDSELLYSLAKQDLKYANGIRPLLTLNKPLIEGREPHEIKLPKGTVYYNTNLNNQAEQKFIKMLLKEYKQNGLITDDAFNVRTEIS